MIKQTKTGWVDLSNLVKRGKNINWKESIGKTIDFQYNNINGVILVSGYYDKRKVYIDIDGYVSKYLVHTVTITRAHLGDILNQKSLKGFKYNIGDIVNDTLLITNQYRNDKNVKMYDYECLKDGYRGTKPERDLDRGRGCPVCSGCATLAGYNDIATTHPHLVKYFKNPTDATKYSVSSGKETWFKCPLCGGEKYTSVCSAFQNGYSCATCRDGSSYNNKFVYCFLTQIQKLKNISIESEKSFVWSRKLDKKRSKKMYDFYVTYALKPIIIEAHGEQHYARGFEYCGGRTLEEEQENDLFKYALALQNGFDEGSYIVLDCRNSDREFIKQSILNSLLPNIFGFSEEDIDWVECDRYACSNLIKIACDLWNSGMHNCVQIAKIMGKAHCTISGYLQKGHNIGWIEYEPKDKMPVMCLENNYVFPYSTICSNYSEELLGVFISKKCVINNLCGDSKSTHGFHFKHITRKEFNRIKQTEPWRVFE